MNNPSASFMQPAPVGIRIKRYAAPAAPAPHAEPSVAPEPSRLALRAARPVVEAPRPALDALPAEIEVELIAILEAPAPAHLTSSHAFKLREEALLFVMSALSIAQSKRLHTRLVAQMSDDTLATAFHLRLVGDRRNRILLFLSQAPRRQALRNAR